MRMKKQQKMHNLFNMCSGSKRLPEFLLYSAFDWKSQNLYNVLILYSLVGGKRQILERMVF